MSVPVHGPLLPGDLVEVVVPFMCIEPSPAKTITGRSGWPISASIPYGTPGPIVASVPRILPRKRNCRAYQLADEPALPGALRLFVIRLKSRSAHREDLTDRCPPHFAPIRFSMRSRSNGIHFCRMGKPRCDSCHPVLYFTESHAACVGPIRRSHQVPSSTKTAILAGVAAVGALLFVFPFATGLISKTQGVESLTGNLRAAFEPQALEQTRADMNTIQAMADQLQAQTLPALPAALEMSPEQFQQFMGQNFPDVATGVGQLDTILPRFQNLVTGLDAQAPNFRAADEIPTNFLPSTTVPLLFLIPGALLVVLAAGALVFGRNLSRTTLSRATLVASVVTGLVFVGAPWVLSVPAKASAVDDLTSAFDQVFTDEGAASIRADFTVIEKMADQLQTQTVPALMQGLRMDPTQFQAFMVENFPAVADGMAQLDDILPRFAGLVTGIDQNVGNFQQAASIPTAEHATTTLTWWFVLPGIALIILGGAGLLTGTSARDERLASHARTLETV